MPIGRLREVGAHAQGSPLIWVWSPMGQWVSAGLRQGQWPVTSIQYSVGLVGVEVVRTPSVTR